MIRHVVFFKFKAEASADEIDNALAQLRDLPNKIEVIRDFEVGKDVLRAPRSWDAVIVATYDDLAALEQYTNHPAHTAVVETLRPLTEAVGSVDFEA